MSNETLISTGQNEAEESNSLNIGSSEERYLNSVMHSTFRELLEDVPQANKKELFYTVAKMMNQEKSASEVFIQIVKDTYSFSNSDDSVNAIGSLLDYEINTGTDTDTTIEFNDEKMLATKEVAEILNVARNTVTNRLKAGTLIGYTPKGSRPIYPAWQFAESSLLTGIQEVLYELNQTGIKVIRSFRMPLERAAGKSILDLLREGNYQKALDMATFLKD